MRREQDLQAIEQGLDALIFDFDGVLVDSDELHWEAYRRAFAAFEIDFRLADYVERAKGHGRDVVVGKFAGSLPAEDRAEIARLKASHAEQIVSEGELHPVAGVRPFLESARSRGLLCAVASTSVLAPIAVEAIGLAGAFDAVCARLPEERSKPAPDIFLRSFASVNARADRCLVIEDTPTGVRAGLSAGASVVVRGCEADWAEEADAPKLAGIFETFDDLHERLGWGRLDPSGEAQ